MTITAKPINNMVVFVLSLFGRVVQKRCRLLIKIPLEFIVKILSGSGHNDNYYFVFIIFNSISKFVICFVITWILGKT